MSVSNSCTVFISLIVFAISPSIASANSVEKILWDNALATYDVTKTSLSKNFQVSDVSIILSSACDNEWSNQHEVHALELSSEAYDKDVGLEFRAGYTSRDIQRDLDNMEGSTYMELSWDLMSNGYLDNQYQAMDYRRQAALKALSGKMKQHEINYQCRRYNLAKHFSGMEAHLNTIKLHFMEAVYKVEKDAYFSGTSYFDELMISEEDIMLTRQNLAHLLNDVSVQADLSNLINPPVIDVDLSALLEQIAVNKDFIESRRLARLQVEDQYQREDSFLQGSRFRLFLRKEFALVNSGSDDLVAGFRLQVPLTFGKPASQTEARLNQLEQDLSHEQWEIVTRTRSAYYSLQEQLERTTRQQYRLLRAQEKMRRVLSYTALDLQLDIAAVNVRLKNYIDAAIELGQAKQELYRRVNEMFLVSKVEYDEKFIKINELNETQHRARQGDRSVYLWSEQFNQHSNQELFMLLETKAIRHAMISVGNKINQAKLFQFMKEADRNKVKVSQLLGESNWALPEQHARVLSVIEARAQYGNSIHLDIEPHVLPQYKANKNQVLSDYIALLQSIRLRHPTLDLAISIPHHWPEEVLLALNDYVDQVYIMAYETSDTDQLSTRIKRVLSSVPLSKVVVALRKEDFVDELQLERVISMLGQSTGVSQFAVHKLDIYTQE